MFGALDIDSLHFETRLLIRKVRELTGENERDAVHRAMAERYLRLTRPDTSDERRLQVLKLLDSIWLRMPGGNLGRAMGRTDEDAILADRPDGRMTLDAHALCLIATRGPGYELVIDNVVKDTGPRICATALAEAAILLRARGDQTAEQTVQFLIDSLNLTVMPFTASDWKAAARLVRGPAGPCAR